MKTKKRAVFIDNLRLLRGQINAACRATGISTVTYYRWLEKFPSFVEAVNTVKAEVYESVENKLLDNIDEGNVQAQIGFLKAKHPEWKHEEKTPVQLIQNNFKVEKLTIEQVDKFIERKYGIASPEKPAV